MDIFVYPSNFFISQSQLDCPTCTHVSTWQSVHIPKEMEFQQVLKLVLMTCRTGREEVSWRSLEHDDYITESWSSEWEVKASRKFHLDQLTATWNSPCWRKTGRRDPNLWGFFPYWMRWTAKRKPSSVWTWKWFPKDIFWTPEKTTISLKSGNDYRKTYSEVSNSKHQASGNLITAKLLTLQTLAYLIQ